MSNKNESEQETLASKTTSRRVSINTTIGTGAVASNSASNSNLQYGWICPKCGKVYTPLKDLVDEAFNDKASLKTIKKGNNCI